MSVRLILYGKITDMEAFKAVGTEMVAHSETEEGTTGYKWHVSDDGSFMLEDVYSDEAAMFAHVGAVTEAGYMDRWMGSMDLAGVMVLDPVSDEAKEALAGFGATHYSMVMGF